MKIVLIVIDGFGIGELPDAALYNDVGANTYRSVAKDIKIPNLIKLGFNNIYGVSDKKSEALGCFARVRELSEGKDTLTGHHEIAGIISYNPSPTFKNAFPDEIIQKLEQAFKTKILGNIVASGTEIINLYGAEHVRTGFPIIYTSSDSVLQIATHEGVVPLEKLYEYCYIARQIMDGEFAVGRIIARPFTTKDKKYVRTANRKDYSKVPRAKTMLDFLMENDIKTVGIGKINDIFCGRGLSVIRDVHGNEECGKALLAELEESEDALIFVNLVDTDMLYGHRNDISGYRECIEKVDKLIGEVKDSITGEDILIITSDHGCDPGFASTDHTREYVPLLIYGKKIANNVDLGTIHGLDCIAFTILDFFNLFSSTKSLKKTLSVKKPNIITKVKSFKIINNIIK